MKKILILTFLVVPTMFMWGCNARPKLRILNWGEYMSDEVIARFETEFGINVVVSTADSNEKFYSKIKSRTTPFDIVIPSDYMIEKMVGEGLLLPLDYTLLPNRDLVTYMDGVEQIFTSMHQTTEARNGSEIDYHAYAIPYFWGTFGIIYNNRVSGLASALESNGWEVYFDANTYFPNARRGMYDVPQYAYAAALMHLGYNPNQYSSTLLQSAKTALQGANFDEWGNDALKRNIEANNLDLAFAYTGDYLDRLYIQIKEGKTVAQVQADFDIYLPDPTMVFVDAMVIPAASKNPDLAHQFINYLLDPEIVALNSESVGYATALEEAFDIIVGYVDSTDHWRKNWAIAYLTYYDKGREGVYYPLTSLNPTDIDQINTMIQDVITGR